MVSNSTLYTTQLYRLIFSAHILL
uniref:Uncharacterized protein n=1 Tax=Rhizophora mucronata TaxID=61149 RepID=A0A2P2P7V1_RHIMU